MNTLRIAAHPYYRENCRIVVRILYQRGDVLKRAPGAAYTSNQIVPHAERNIIQYYALQIKAVRNPNEKLMILEHFMAISMKLKCFIQNMQWRHHARARQVK